MGDGRAGVVRFLLFVGGGEGVGRGWKGHGVGRRCLPAHDRWHAIGGKNFRARGVDTS